MDGRSFVADTDGARIVVLDSAGLQIDEFDGGEAPDRRLIAPRYVAIGPDAMVYVADTATHRVQVFDLDGRWVSGWGGFGTAHGQFNAPSGIAFSDGLIYVADARNSRVEVFDMTRQWVRTIGAPGFGDGQLFGAIGVAVRGGEVFVAEDNNLRVQVFSTAGAYLRQWGLSGPQGAVVSRYGRPSGISVDASGNVAVSDAGGNRVDLCDTNGSGSVMIGTLGSGPGQLRSPGAAVLVGDAVLIPDAGNDRLTSFDRVGSAWGTSASMTAASSDPGAFVSAQSVAASPDGRIYVADTGNDRVQILGRDGSYIGQFSAPPEGWSGPAGVAVSNDGSRVFVSDSGRNRIVMADSDGAYIRTIGETGSADAQFLSPHGLAVLPNDTLVVADTGNSRVQIVDEWGGFRAAWGSEGTGNRQFSSPEGVAVSAQSDIFVADTGNHRVTVFNNVGSYLRTIGSFGEGAGSFRFPTGVSVLPGDRIAVVERGGSRGQVFTEQGSLLGQFGRPGASAGFFRSPTGLTFEPEGSLLVADTGNHVLQRFAPDDTAPSSSATGALDIRGTQPVSVALSSTDASAGVAYIRYSIGGGPEQTYDSTFTVSTEGTTPVSFYAVDRAGNVEPTHTRFAIIDTTPPSGQVTFAGGKPRIATSTVSVEATLVDEVATMSFDGGAGFPAPDTYSPSASFVAPGEGTRTVAARYTDSVGNVGTFTSQLVVDLTAPKVAIAGPPASGITSGNVTVSAVASDTYTGISQLLVSIDGGAEQPYSGATTFGNEGTHTYRVRAVDGVGNSSEVTEAVFAIDRTPPTGALVVAGGAAYVSTRTVSVSVASSDAAQMHLDVGSGYGPRVQFAAESSATLASGDGTRTVRVVLFDTAGNASAVLSDDVRLDTTAPTSAITGIPASRLSSGTVSIGLSSRDDVAGVPGIGVDRILYSIDGAPEATYTETFTVSAEGLRTITYRAVDLFGWAEPAKTATVTIDLTPPSVALGGAPASGITSASVTITATAADAISGVSHVRYRLDGGVETTYTAPIAVTAEGTHAVEAYSVDRVGRVSPTQRVDFNIDRTAPTGTAVLAGGAAFIGSTSTTLSVTSPDAVEMRVDAGTGYGPRGPFVSATPVVLPGEGLRQASVQLFDAAGNSRVATDAVFVDLTAPASTLSGMPIGDITADDVDLALSATDAGSGVAWIGYSIDGGPVRAYDSTFTISSDGTHTIEYAAVDEVGNVEATRTRTLVIDRTAPAGTFRLSGGVSHVNTLTVSAESSMSAAVDMAFDTGSGLGAWMAYDPRASLPLAAEGTHTVIAAYRSRAGVTVYKSDQIIVDLTAPVATVPSAVLKRLVPLGGGSWRFDTDFAWTGTDPGISPSGIVRYERRLGSVVSTATTTGFSAGLRTPGQSLAVRAVDGAGSPSAWVSRQVRVGALARTRVPTTMRPRAPFTVTTAFRAPRSERILLRCYARDAQGRYRLMATFPGKAVKKNGAWVLVARPSLTPGRWLLLFEATSASRTELGLPSAAVTVR